MADAKGYVELVEKDTGFIMGMGVQYSDLEPPLVRDSEHGVWKAGHRAPDLWPSDPKREVVRLYQKLTYGRYLLVLAGTARRDVEVKRPESMTLLRLAGMKARGVGVERRNENGSQEEAHRDACGYSWVKKGEEYAVLVRPDCYVEFVGNVDEGLGYLEERLPGLVKFGAHSNGVNGVSNGV